MVLKPLCSPNSRSLPNGGASGPPPHYPISTPLPRSLMSLAAWPWKVLSVLPSPPHPTPPDPYILNFSFWASFVSSSSSWPWETLRVCRHPPDSAVERACVLSHFSHVQLFATPWTIAHQTPLCPWNSIGKNTGVGCHSLLQGIFLTQRSNPSLLCLLRYLGGHESAVAKSLESSLSPLSHTQHPLPQQIL